MKKVILTLILLLILSGCQQVGGPSADTTAEGTTEFEVYFREDVNGLIDIDDIHPKLVLKDTEFPESVDPITSKDQALEIGEILFVRDGWVLSSVIHTIDTNMWTFLYVEGDKIDWNGGGISIAVDGTTGRVLKAWGGE